MIDMTIKELQDQIAALQAEIARIMSQKTLGNGDDANVLKDEVEGGEAASGGWGDFNLWREYEAQGGNKGSWLRPPQIDAAGVSFDSYGWSPVDANGGRIFAPIIEIRDELLKSKTRSDRIGAAMADNLAFRYVVNIPGVDTTAHEDWWMDNMKAAHANMLFGVKPQFFLKPVYGSIDTQASAMVPGFRYGSRKGVEATKLVGYRMPWLPGSHGMSTVLRRFEDYWRKGAGKANVQRYGRVQTKEMDRYFARLTDQAKAAFLDKHPHYEPK